MGRRAAARDFGSGQEGDVGASPQRSSHLAGAANTGPPKSAMPRFGWPSASQGRPQEPPLRPGVGLCGLHWEAEGRGEVGRPHAACSCVSCVSWLKNSAFRFPLSAKQHSLGIGRQALRQIHRYNFSADAIKSKTILANGDNSVRVSSLVGGAAGSALCQQASSIERVP